MRRHRYFAVLAVAALGAAAAPSTAGAATVQENDAAACRATLARAGTATSDNVAPTVIAGGEGSWFGLFVDGLPGGFTTTLADCAFYDANRNERFDADEQFFGYKVRYTVDPNRGYGITRQQIPFVGVQQDDQVCSTRTERLQPMSGGQPVTSQSELTCYRVSWYLNGQYAA